ncbi:class I SAM-dependent methyltransferase [Winogradskyella sp.]|uniref:class I SAM-dependent methyltransferase n=1 Tax=Winogradskyella sp. TaxID=1883156 RepID=UPI002625269F|nr:class I SAM-dependent methyltransferase [Winogradskyella sp.]
MDPRNFLLDKMPKYSICAEIGSWLGDFSRRIMDRTAPKKLYLIDPYLYISEYQKAWYGGMIGSQKKMDEVYNYIVDKFKKEINNKQLEIKRNFSSEALSTFPNDSLDWVYIDGNHTYDYVKKDLNISWNKVKIGGFITGDDYNVVGWWDNGVTIAVDEFIKLNEDFIGKTYIKGTQFIIEKIR